MELPAMPQISVPDHGPEDRKKAFDVQIDRDHYKVEKRRPTARELLGVAGKTPAENFALYLKPKKGAPIRLDLDEHVDLSEPGKERFVTLPLDQTEGLGSDRREFTLPAEDTEWLQALGNRFEMVLEAGVLRVVIYDFIVSPGYNHASVDVNVRIDPGYPDTQIDMVYFHPALARTDGVAIGALATDLFQGLTWQRWSRHRTAANPWRPGIDGLGTHFALIQHWLHREFDKG
jgi:hypothetical protein